MNKIVKDEMNFVNIASSKFYSGMLLFCFISFSKYNMQNYDS